MDDRIKMLEAFKNAWERVDEALYDAQNLWGDLENAGYNPAEEIEGDGEVATFPFDESLDEQWHQVADYREMVQVWVGVKVAKLRKESEQR